MRHYPFTFLRIGENLPGELYSPGDIHLDNPKVVVTIPIYLWNSFISHIESAVDKYLLNH